MSSNLPVATTSFEGITTFFKEGDGLIFVEKESKYITYELKKMLNLKKGSGLLLLVTDSIDIKKANYLKEKYSKYSKYSKITILSLLQKN